MKPEKQPAPKGVVETAARVVLEGDLRARDLVAAVRRAEKAEALLFEVTELCDGRTREQRDLICRIDDLLEDVGK